MEAIIGYGLGVWILGIALLISPLMIWYHVGHASRKLSRIIELLEKQEGITSQKETKNKDISIPSLNKPIPLAIVSLIFASILIYALIMAWKLYKSG